MFFNCLCFTLKCNLVFLLCLTLMSFLHCHKNQSTQTKNYHPSDYVHGLLAAHVYETSINGESLLVKSGIFKKYLNVSNDQENKVIHELLDKCSVYEVIDDPMTDYYGVIYKNDADKQLVLAHRGTDKSGSFFEDFNGVINSKRTAYHLKYKESTSKVVDLVKANANSTQYALSFTGHSLGGWISKISVYYCHRCFNLTNVKAVTFDPPGSEKIILDLCKNDFTIQSQEGTFNVTHLDIVSYLSMPNLVNSINKHIGIRYLVNNTGYKKRLSFLEKTSSLLGFPRLADEHSLKFILEKFNHTTGRPIIIQEIKR